MVGIDEEFDLLVKFQLPVYPNSSITLRVYQRRFSILHEKGCGSYRILETLACLVLVHKP